MTRLNKCAVMMRGCKAASDCAVASTMMFEVFDES